MSQEGRIWMSSRALQYFLRGSKPQGPLQPKLEPKQEAESHATRVYFFNEYHRPIGNAIKNKNG